MRQGGYVEQATQSANDIRGPLRFRGRLRSWRRAECRRLPYQPQDRGLSLSSRPCPTDAGTGAGTTGCPFPIRYPPGREQCFSHRKKRYRAGLLHRSARWDIHAEEEWEEKLRRLLNQSILSRRTKMVGFIIGAFVLVAIVASSLTNKDDLNRYQQLKNKRRFSGRRLSLDEQSEIDRLARKYWWW